MTDWKSIGKKLAGAGLPILGAQLGGPAGAAVGREVAARIGVEPDPEVVAQAIGDDSTLLEIKRMEIEAAAAERAYALEVAASDEANVRAAREITDLNPTRERMAYITLSVLILALGGLVATEVIWDVPDMVLGLAVGVIGGLSTMYQQMIGFFFGTSSGSAAKERIMAERSR